MTKQQFRQPSSTFWSSVDEVEEDSCNDWKTKCLQLSDRLDGMFCVIKEAKERKEKKLSVLLLPDWGWLNRQETPHIYSNITHYYLTKYCPFFHTVYNGVYNLKYIHTTNERFNEQFYFFQGLRNNGKKQNKFTLHSLMSCSIFKIKRTNDRTLAPHWASSLNQFLGSGNLQDNEPQTSPHDAGILIVR